MRNLNYPKETRPVERGMASEEIYRAIFENSVEGAILIDETGSIVEWNKFMENTTNLKKGYVCGKKVWDIQHSLLTNDFKERYTLDVLKNIWVEFIRTLDGSEIIIKEGQYPDKHGKLILTEDIVFPLRIRGKKFLYVIQRDMTERRNLEQQLKIHEQNLSHLNQTKDRIISIISHDLRSPITAILGFSQMLCEDFRTFDFEKLEEYLKHINTSTEHTLRLLDNLLVWSRTQTGQLSVKPGFFQLNSLVQEIIDSLDSSASLKNIKLNYTNSDEIDCYADLNILKIVLRNLVHNGIKFTRYGGKVEISAFLAGDQLEITVADNGTGMDEETRNKLFQTGITVSKPGTLNEKGSGLGLILCKELIEKHGGRIWVESELGSGSKFSFSLNIKQDSKDQLS